MLRRRLACNLVFGLIILVVLHCTAKQPSQQLPDRVTKEKVATVTVRDIRLNGYTFQGKTVKVKIYQRSDVVEQISTELWQNVFKEDKLRIKAKFPGDAVEYVQDLSVDRRGKMRCFYATVKLERTWTGGEYRDIPVLYLIGRRKYTDMRGKVTYKW